MARLIYDKYPIASVALSQRLPGFFSDQFRSEARSLMLELVLQRNKDLFDDYVKILHRLGGAKGKNLFLLANRATDLAGFQFEDITPLQAAILRQDPQILTLILEQINLNKPEELKDCEAQLNAIGPIPTYESLPECIYNFKELAQVISNASNADLEAVLAFNWREHELMKHRSVP